jgi:hypothetical protein
MFWELCSVIIAEKMSASFLVDELKQKSFCFRLGVGEENS